MKDQIIAAAFMSAGLHRSPENLSFILDYWNNGCIELVERLVAYVPYTLALLDAGYPVVGECPGVAAYEVAAEFGVWFGEQVLLTDGPCMEPEPASCYVELRRLVYAFYLKDAGTANPFLVAALSGVREENNSYAFA